MTIRIAKAFGSTTETWIRLQTAYDIARARERAAQPFEIVRFDTIPWDTTRKRGLPIS